MKPVSDLLREVTADAPPLRSDVDDVVAAGRRRQRRRNGGWTIAAAAAVAVAIGAPQIATHADGPPPMIAPAVPSVAATTPEPFTFAFPFRGYPAGDYRVGDPHHMRISGTTAQVLRGSKRVGSLIAFAPGVVPESLYSRARRVETAPVNGRPAHVLREKGQPDRLAWEYADGAVAVVLPDSGELFPSAALRRIAEGFRTGKPRPATVAFKVGYLPSDLRLLTVISGAGSEATASLAFISDRMAKDMLSRPGRDLPPGAVPTVVTVSLMPPEPAAGYPPRKATCTAEESTCVVAVGDKGHRIEVYGQGVALAEIRKILDGVVPAADPEKVGTWFAANDAAPAFALLPAR